MIKFTLTHCEQLTLSIGFIILEYYYYNTLINYYKIIYTVNNINFTDEQTIIK